MVALPHWPIPHNFETYDLSRIRIMLGKLGNPEAKLPLVIHIAGTNGKGSCAAYLTSILQAAGKIVHRYTSPHIMQFNERITLANQQIDDGTLYRFIEEARIAADDMPCTFFEGTTAAAFLAFANVPADFLILETGMGGLYDPTNVVLPHASIIMPVALDHTEYLGHSIREIASHKAGIMKPQAPTIVSWQYQEALEVFVAQAFAIGSPLFVYNRDWSLERQGEGFVFLDLLKQKSLAMPKPSLLGVHQYLNAATAVAAAEYLHLATQEQIANGIASAIWPARLQKIQNGYWQQILPANVELWMDGAHNAHGATMLAASIADMWRDIPTVLIHGRTAGRSDIAAFLAPLSKVVEKVWCLPVASEPKPEDPCKLAFAAQELGLSNTVVQDIKAAVQEILQEYKGPIRILVTGSLYLWADLHLAR